MKCVIQNYRTGKLDVADIPAPALKPGGILVQNAASLVSAGTEKLMVDLAQKSLIGKAADRPDLVKQVIDKARRDGPVATFETVMRRLDTPMPLGYSTSGTVIETGARADGFRVGDRVACAGAGYASHAEVVYIPKNLAAKLPDGVDFESAAFTTMGAIALQGFRLAEPQLGETVVVIGLGLLGLLTCQLAKAAGCLVLGMDTNPDRCALARRLGIDGAVPGAAQLADLCSRETGGRGADRVLITAGTKSNGPVDLAGEVARERAVVVAVGAVGMEIPRKTYYGKELTFRVSRSYGPGRYDAGYEENGHDYPAGYVRWTENRNMQAFVQKLAEGKVRIEPLITHRFAIGDAAGAYDLITGKKGEPFLGILLTYPGKAGLTRRIEVNANSEMQGRADEARNAEGEARGGDVVRVGMLGAGSFATSILIPVMKKVRGIELRGVCTATGVSANHAARKFGFRYATTDEGEILNDPDINAVVITTRHNLHARQVSAALKAGKNVFVEKPLCLTAAELEEIESVYSSQSASHSSLFLMVGYNRRFAPMAVKMKEFLSAAGEPLMMHYRVNAGYIPPDHWVHDPEAGGGRIIGEVCHFIDFLMFLCGSLPVRVSARGLPDNERYRNDNIAVTVEFENGSLGTVTYVANGDKACPKERVEVFGGGAVAVLDNFRSLELMKNGRTGVVRSRLRQDKGHRGEWEAFAKAAILKDSDPPISFGETRAVAAAVFSALKSLEDASPALIARGLGNKPPVSDGPGPEMA